MHDITTCSFAILIVSPANNVLEPIVNTISPLDGSYSAPETLNTSPLLTIPLASADTQVWVEVSVEGILSNTWISNWVPVLGVSTLNTLIHLPLIGSVSLGYFLFWLNGVTAPTLTVIV